MSVSLHQNATSLARQISGLECFERLRADQPQDRNGKKWIIQLRGFCQKVSDLYDRISQGLMTHSKFIAPPHVLFGLILIRMFFKNLNQQMYEYENTKFN